MRNSFPNFWTWLVAAVLIGIAFTTVDQVLSDRAMGAGLDRDHPESQTPNWSKNLGRASTGIILISGLLYLNAPAGFRFGRHYRMLLCGWIGWGFVLAARNLSPHDFLTPAVLFPLAPGAAIAACLLFASANRQRWSLIVQVVAYAALAISLIALVEMVLVRSGSRGDAYSHLDTLSKILEITAIVAFGWFAKTGKAWLGSIPIITLICASIAMQTRLMIVEVIALFVFYRIFSQRKLSTNAVVAVCAIGIVLVVGTYFAWYSPNSLRSTLPASASAFWDRSADDTRSAQFVNFFQKVPPSDFLLGIGIPRPGEFTGLGTEGIDLGYVNILFIGGIPSLVLFFLIHLLPAVKCLGSKFDSVDAGCLAAVMTYGVRMFSSTIPGLSPSYFLLMLVVGHCAILADEKNRGYMAAPSRVPAVPAYREREVVVLGSKGAARVGNN